MRNLLWRLKETPNKSQIGWLSTPSVCGHIIRMWIRLVTYNLQSVTRYLITSFAVVLLTQPNVILPNLLDRTGKSPNKKNQKKKVKKVKQEKVVTNHKLVLTNDSWHKVVCLWTRIEIRSKSLSKDNIYSPNPLKCGQKSKNCRISQAMVYIAIQSHFRKRTKKKSKISETKPQTDPRK